MNAKDWREQAWRVRFIALCRSITLSLRHSIYTNLFHEVTRR